MDDKVTGKDLKAALGADLDSFTSDERRFPDLESSGRELVSCCRQLSSTDLLTDWRNFYG